MTSANPAAAVGDTNATPESREVTFNLTTWNLPQAVAVNVTSLTNATVSATPDQDYEPETVGRVTLAAGTLVVRTRDDRRVEPTKTFRVTLPDDPLLEIVEATAVGRIEDDDTEWARQRSLRMVLAGVGRTLATDAEDVIGDRFLRQTPSTRVTGGHLA